MTDEDRCFVSGCDRRAAASVTRGDLPGQLRLCATHTEQFRQSSEGWGITWPSGAPAPSSVTAPSSDVLWAYRPPVHEPEPAPAKGEGGPLGRGGLPGRAASWIEARRANRHQSHK
jgi:hypothetical protein